MKIFYLNLAFFFLYQSYMWSWSILILEQLIHLKSTSYNYIFPIFMASPTSLVSYPLVFFFSTHSFSLPFSPSTLPSFYPPISGEPGNRLHGTMQVTTTLSSFYFTIVVSQLCPIQQSFFFNLRYNIMLFQGSI